MSRLATSPRRERILAATGLALLCVAGCGKHPPPAAAVKPVPVAASTNMPASPTNEAALAYVSVFENLLPPQGKDPFFPKSHRREPAPPPEVAAAVPAKLPPVAPILVLKGVVGSAKRRVALINNETMEPGETSLVRVPDGRVRVECLGIGPDYVLIKVEGEKQPKRLELGK